MANQTTARTADAAAAAQNPVPTLTAKADSAGRLPDEGAVRIYPQSLGLAIHGLRIHVGRHDVDPTAVVDVSQRAHRRPRGSGCVAGRGNFGGGNRRGFAGGFA